MKHLLVLCPRLAPYNGADAQRVRVMLPHLAKHGWRATVLAASEDSEAGGGIDPELLETLPSDAEVIRIRAWPRGVMAAFGFRQHMLRAWYPWRAALRAVTARRRFDAVFVSHTDFALWPLTAECAAPVVLDWQDPWWSDYHSHHAGRADRLEAGCATARCSGTPAPRARRGAKGCGPRGGVGRLHRPSPGTLSGYPGRAVLGAAICRRRERPVPCPHARRAATLPPGRKRWWVYAGRGGKDLHFALSAFFDALCAARQSAPERYADLGVLFVGTAYDARDRSAGIAALARARGVGDMVIEEPQRVGQLETYRLLEAAEALIVPGSDDPAYVPSKLAPYLLTRKPILGLFHCGKPCAPTRAGSSRHAVPGVRGHERGRDLRAAAGGDQRTVVRDTAAPSRHGRRPRSARGA